MREQLQKPALGFGSKTRQEDGGSCQKDFWQRVHTYGMHQKEGVKLLDLNQVQQIGYNIFSKRNHHQIQKKEKVQDFGYFP